MYIVHTPWLYGVFKGGGFTLIVDEVLNTFICTLYINNAYGGCSRDLCVLLVNEILNSTLSYVHTHWLKRVFKWFRYTFTAD